VEIDGVMKLTQWNLPVYFPATNETPRIQAKISSARFHADTLQFSGKSHSALFPNGIERLWVEQHGRGSCQTLSTLVAAGRNPAGARQLKSMITEHSDGHYSVTFPAPLAEPEKGPITVNLTKEELAQDPDPLTQPEESALTKLLEEINEKIRQIPLSHARKIPLYRRPMRTIGDPGGPLMEAAYAKYMKVRYPERFNDVSDERALDIYRHPQRYSDPKRAIEDILGWQTTQFVAKTGSTQKESPSFAEVFKHNTDRKYAFMQILRQFEKNPDGQIIIAGTKMHPPGQPWHLDGGLKVLPFHDLALKNVDLAAGSVDVIDPHNSRLSLNFDLDYFLEMFNTLTLGNAPSQSQ
jgi:hypothetical protein